MALDDLLKPRMTELGQIKIGGKGDERPTRGGGTFRLPEKYDHFLITTLNRNARGDLIEDVELMKTLVEKLGDQDGQLRQVPISLLSDDPEEIMQSAYVCYSGKRCAARSDGKTVTWFADPDKRQWLAEPRIEPWDSKLLELKASNGAPLFKLHTTFNCVITTANSRWGGVYKFRTTSRISADQLYGSLLHIQQLTRGVLVGLPLRLVVRPMQVTPDGKATTVYVVHVELRGPDFGAIQEMAARLLEAKVRHVSEIEHSKAAYRKLLCAPGEESDDLARDIAEEFHPEVEPGTIIEPPANAESVLSDLIGDGAGDTIIDGEAREVAPSEREQANTPGDATSDGDWRGLCDELRRIAKPDQLAMVLQEAGVSDIPEMTVEHLRQAIKDVKQTAI